MLTTLLIALEAMFQLIIFVLKIAGYVILHGAIPATLIAGLIWIATKKKKAFGEYLWAILLMTVIFSAGCFGLSHRTVYLEPLAQDEISSMYVQEDYYDKDGKKNSTYATTTNTEWYDNLLRAVEEKKLRKIGEKDIEKAEKDAFEFTFIFQDEDEEAIRTFQFYNEMEFSVTEGDEVKYYRFKEDHVNFDVMKDIVQ